MQALKHSIHAVRDAASARIVRQFASAHHLVYFGAVDYRHDEHELVRGITATTHHRDAHYTVGTVNGRDIIVVLRRNRLTFPGKPARDHAWLILQCDLRVTGLPRIFIDAKRHNDVFYANLSLMKPKLEDMTPALVPHGHQFADVFRIFCSPGEIESANRVIRENLLDTLATQFKHFDFELHDDSLFIYALVGHPQRAVLDDMLRIGLWLADNIDS